MIVEQRTAKSKQLKFPIGTNVTVTKGRYEGRSGTVIGKADAVPRDKHEVVIGKNVITFDQDYLKIIAWRI